MKKYFGLALNLIGIVIICLGFVTGLTAVAQQTNGTIAGSVTDPAGAGVVGATVKVTSLETNDTFSATTSKVGSYRIESVHPGDYRVEVTAPGFAMETVAKVAVEPSVITSVDVHLTVGANTTNVEVNSEAVAALQTDSGELAETMTNVEINNLPISSLNPYQLMTTLPGVTVPTGGMQSFANGYAISVNGNRARDNNFLVEGVDNNDQGLHGQAWQPENLEAIDEVSFLLDSFPAEYGRGGAVSNLTIKSGSNTFHGAVYELLLNSALDGEDKGDILNQVPKVKSRENLFGFRIGGPVIHDRLFFFVSNLWDRYRATANLGILTLPTAAGYTALQAYNSEPQVADLLQAYGTLRGTNMLYSNTISLGPDPTVPVTATTPSRGTVAVAGYQRSLGNANNTRELEATADWKLDDADRLRFRFINSPYSTPYDVGNFPNQLPGFDTDQSGSTNNAGVVYTHNFSSNLLNELRPAWSRIGFGFNLRPETASNPLLLSTGNINISGLTGYGIPTNVPQGRFQNTYQLEDALTWVKGTNTMKFGFDIEDQRIRDGIPFNFYGSTNFLKSSGTCTVNTTNPTCPAGSSSYTALGNFLDNYGGTAATATINFGSPTARPQIWVQNYYGEDSWKVVPNLTLEFGLRYEYYGAPFNYLPYPAFDSSNPTVYPGGLKEIPNKQDFGPRLGFNYGFNDKTVLSGGFGVFYSHVFTNIIDNIQGSSPNAASKQVTSSSSGRGTPNWFTILPTTYTTAASKLPFATDTANVIVPNLKEPLTYEYNLRVQRELPSGFVASAEYVGNRSEHQYATTEFNPYKDDLLSGARLFSGRGRIIREDNTADSNYNSGQFEILRRGRNGLTLRADYTYSKLLDDGSEIFTASGNANLSTYAEIQYPSPRRREYGPSAFDHRNRIVVSAVYMPPRWSAGEGMHWAGAIVNGWTFSGISTFQSGQPINVELGYDWNGDGISNDRPILLNKNAPITNWAIKGDDPIFGFGLAPGTLCDGPEWWATNDPCHVVSAANTHWVASYAGSTQNTVGRNYFFADHASNTDFTIERSFHTFETQDFTIGVQALNVFNHGSTGSWVANLINGVPFNGMDAFGNSYSGNVTFANKPLTVSGNRELRIQARYEF